MTRDLEVGNPMNENPDDTRCYVCGARLAEYPEVGSWSFDGFCDARCAAMAHEAEQYTAEYDFRPTLIVEVRWEEDEEWTEVEVSPEEYEILYEMAGRE